MSPNVHQTSYELLRDALRSTLAAAVGSECNGGIGSTPCRASAALYALLGAHRVGLRGRCRSCRGLRALHWRRVCRVLVAARFHLYQPEDMLLRLLASELVQPATPPLAADAAPQPGRAPGAAFSDSDATDVLPRIS